MPGWSFAKARAAWLWTLWLALLTLALSAIGFGVAADLLASVVR